MEKSKGSKSRDRLSKLPDSLLFEIFWYLPMREVVKTTILSHRWKTLWTTTSCLNFEDLEVETDTDGVRNFINRALILWKGTTIQKFKIDFGEHLKKSLYNDIDFWLLFATKYGVQVLHVSLPESVELIPEGIGAIKSAQEKVSWAPQCLYSCSSLRILALGGCNLQISHGNVNWIQLEQLIIIGYFVSADLIKQVLCGSPQLEVLKLTLMENDENLNIQSTSLKSLIIRKYVYLSDDAPYVDTELRIETPKLECLKLRGTPYIKCLINDVPFLFHATIYFDHMFNGNDFVVGETLKQILPAIQYVDELVLSDWCIKALGAMTSENMLSPFPDVVALQLKGCFEEYKQKLHLLEIFPNVETLFIKHKKVNKQLHGGESLNFEADFPNSFLQELRKIVITWDKVDDSIFPFIETLLLYAKQLKKMVFRSKETAPLSNTLFLAMKKLMRMPRSSPTAELILL